MKKLTWKQWEKRKQAGDPDLLLGEAADLEKGQIRGDNEAQEILDDDARVRDRDTKIYAWLFRYRPKSR